MNDVVTLDDCVRGHLINKGRNTLHGYIRYLKYAVDFLKKVSLDHSFMDKTVVLRLDEKKALQLPEDCVTWNKVGWKSGDRIIAFQLDQTISLSHSYEEDSPSATPNVSYNINEPWPYNGSFPQVNFYNYTLQDGTVGFIKAYGVGNNGLGYFKLNARARELQFSSDVPSDWEIYLEYKTTGFEPKTKSTIPIIMSKLCEDYIDWQDARHKLGAASNEAQARMIEFNREYDEVLSQLDKWTPDELVGARARTYDVNKIVH